MKNDPTVSCLCVTRERVPLLKRAVACFTEQIYPNRELLVVYEDGDKPTAGYLRGLADPRIRPIRAPSAAELTLGELRNLAVEKCRGEYFCQWDDDDYSHPDRIAFQMEVVRQSGLDASILFQWLIFDAPQHQAYLSNRRLWEGSLLCKTALIGGQNGYDRLASGEDTALVKRLFSENRVFPILMPKLYIYVYHGANVWNRTHWDTLFAASRKLSDASGLIINDVLNLKYKGKAAAAMLDRISE